MYVFKSAKLSSEKHLFAVKINKLPGTIYGQLKETISL